MKKIDVHPITNQLNSRQKQRWGKLQKKVLTSTDLSQIRKNISVWIKNRNKGDRSTVAFLL